jgi:hypothetical protein
LATSPRSPSSGPTALLGHGDAATALKTAEPEHRWSVPPHKPLPRPDPGPLTIARQDSFFIGGREVKSDTLSTLPAYAASGFADREARSVTWTKPGSPGRTTAKARCAASAAIPG